MDYEKVYKQYADDVYKFLLKLSGDEHIAEEFTQECFFKAYKNMDKYDGSCKLSVWLCQIAKNSYFDYCRKKKPVSLEEDVVGNFNIEDIICNKDTAIQIHKILHTLDEPYKEVFTLKVFGELSYKDISDLFGKSENWSRVIFFRAKAKIIERIDNSHL